MQGPAVAEGVLHSRRLHARTVTSGIFLLVVGIFYVEFISPLANVPVPANYRFQFSFESNIYSIFFLIYAAHFVYRLVRPKHMESQRGGSFDKGSILGIVLRAAFLLVVGGSYLTGAMIATPQIFAFAAPITGLSGVVFASNLHALSATLMIALGVSIVIYEFVRVVRGKQTLKQWFFGGRYPEIKLLYWFIAIAVIFQGVLGLFLLGTVSPVGPFGLIGQNAYALETLIRLIHGPMGAVIISMFYGHLYLRIRPEYSIR